VTTSTKHKRPSLAAAASTPSLPPNLVAQLEQYMVRSPFGPRDEPEIITRARHVSVPVAAEFIGVSEDTFIKRYPHLINKLSTRRRGVNVGRLLDLVAELEG
jgi:hypothetical protein